jgi:transcriptional regulator with XRE-family HTH domain
MEGSLMAICHHVKRDNCHAQCGASPSIGDDMARTPRPDAYSAVQKTIGLRIRWARELLVPNRAEFARTLGVDRTTVQKIEQGKRPPSVFNVMEFAHALRVDPNYILLGSMRGIDGELAAALAAAHPELATQPSSREDTSGMATVAGKGPKPRKSGRGAS